MSLILTKLEADIYEYLKNKKETELDALLELFIEQKDSVRRAIELFKQNGIIEEITKTNIFYELDVNGIDALEKGFIEERLCDYLFSNKTLISQINELSIPSLKKEDVSLSFGLAKKQQLVSVENEIIIVNKDYKKKFQNQKQLLEAISLKKTVSEKEVQELFKRKQFILKKENVFKKYVFLKIINYNISEIQELYLSSEHIKTKSWKDVSYKKFDVTKLPSPKEIGRVHPLRVVCRNIREAYQQMGFKEMKGPYIETSFWNMDAMFISQNHPARDIQDTFYLKEKGELPKDPNLIQKIAETHKNGWRTGSSGYQYTWNEEIAKKLVLRTHTTATTYRTFHTLSEEEKDNSKYFCIDKVFRNETIDYTHLPEFHQAEGFIIGDNLSLSDLMAFINEFFKKFGITKVRFKPTYNPYTEPSVEASGYHEKTKTWIELINAGIFRPESLLPFGITKTVIAWGFGVERLAMFIYQKPIKDIHGDEPNLDWLRNYVVPKIELM